MFGRKALNISNNINILEIIELLSHLSKDEMKQINLPNYLLRYYKKHPSRLVNSKLHTLLVLNDYIKTTKTNFIGIDLGKYHYLAASNIDRSLVYIDSSNETFNLFQKYEKRREHKTYDNVLAYTKLKVGLTNHINQEVNKLIKQFKSYKNIYVLGTHNYSSLSFPSLIFDLTYLAIKAKMNQYDEIVIVDESFTSIECPECGYRNKNNRSKRNHFKCQKCEFYHDIDDVVAASNIAKRGLSRSHINL